MSDTQRSAFVPGVLLASAVLGWSAFQLTQLLAERDNLSKAIAGQEQQMAQSKEVRGRLDGLAQRTARLARGGNANATLVVEQLRRRGITINTESSVSETVAPPQP